MKLYLGWLDKYERQEDENAPVEIILCAESSREQIELLKMDRDGIVVAEYWTALPPKAEFEQKIHAILVQTRCVNGLTFKLLRNRHLALQSHVFTTIYLQMFDAIFRQIAHQNPGQDTRQN